MASSEDHSTLVRIPILRELWGMPYSTTVEVLLDSHAKNGVVQVGDDIDPLGGQVHVAVTENHLDWAVLIARVPCGPAEEHQVHACEAAITHGRLLNRCADALEDIAGSLQGLGVFSEKFDKAQEEAVRRSRMPPGGLRP